MSSLYTDFGDEPPASGYTFFDDEQHSTQGLPGFATPNLTGYTSDSIPTPPGSLGSDRAWNEEYQKLIDWKTTIETETFTKFSALNSLLSDFLNVAETQGQIIIRETYLPNEEKTIQPIDVGGVAGGTKYLSRGVFFKFVKDSSGLYGSDARAMKAAGLELQGLRAYSGVGVPGLHYPLMTIVDYRGFRLIASVMLPLFRGTLVYGSSDGGQTVHADIPEFNELMKHAGAALKLKEHVAGNTATLVTGPVDIEGHHGTDGRFYVLDTARIFPPETPSRFVSVIVVPAGTSQRYQLLQFPDKTWREDLGQHMRFPLRDEPDRCKYLGGNTMMYYFPASGGTRNFKAQQISGVEVYGDAVIVQTLQASHLWRLLRPEALQLYADKPVSSDAFSYFGRHDASVHNAEVIQLTTTMRGKIVELAQKINLMEESPRTLAELRECMHSHGFNMRYLGVLLDNVTDTFQQCLIVTDMIQRVAKGILRERLRNIGLVDNASYYQAVVDFFNILCGKSEKVADFYRSEVRVRLIFHFGWYGPFLEEKLFDPDFDMSIYALRTEMFHALQESVGVRFTDECNARMKEQIVFYVEQPFQLSDLMSPEKDGNELFLPVSCPISDKNELLVNLIRQFQVFPLDADLTVCRPAPVNSNYESLEQFLLAIEHVFGKESIPAVMAHSLIGYHFFQLGQFAEAAAALEKGKRIQELYEDVLESDMRVGLLLLLGDAYKAMEMWEPAFREYYAAFGIAERRYGVTQSLTLYRSSYRKMGEYTHADLVGETQQGILEIQQKLRDEYQQSIDELTKNAAPNAPDPVAIGKLFVKFNRDMIEERKKLATQVVRGHATTVILVDRCLECLEVTQEFQYLSKLQMLFLSAWSGTYFPIDAASLIHFFGRVHPVGVVMAAKHLQWDPQVLMDRFENSVQMMQFEGRLGNTTSIITRQVHTHKYFFMRPDLFSATYRQRHIREEPSVMSSRVTEDVLAQLPHLRCLDCAVCKAPRCKHRFCEWSTYPVGSSRSMRLSVTTEAATFRVGDSKTYMETVLNSVGDDDTQEVNVTVTSYVPALPQPMVIPTKTFWGRGKLNKNAQFRGTDVIVVEGLEFECEIYEQVMPPQMMGPVEYQTTKTEWICDAIDFPVRVKTMRRALNTEHVANATDEVMTVLREDLDLDGRIIPSTKFKGTDINQGHEATSYVWYSTLVPGRVVKNHREYPVAATTLSINDMCIESVKVPGRDDLSFYNDKAALYNKV